MSRAQPIRLGGVAAREARTATASSIEVLPERFASPLPEAIDLERLINALGLDHDETRFLMAWKAERIPLVALADHLHWTERKVRAMQVHVGRRLKRLRALDLDPRDFVIKGDSLHLSYEQELSPGRTCYALAQLSPSFAEIMNAERMEWFGRAPERKKGKFISHAA